MTEVTVRSEGGLAQTISTSTHTLISDEPAATGGTDLGPTPYELLLAGLGACTAITLRLYAQRKGWPLEAVEVRLAHERVHARDCADCETQTGFLERITKQLVLRGPLTAEQRQRLTAIAERCPVQQTLQRQVLIQQQLLDD